MVAVGEIRVVLDECDMMSICSRWSRRFPGSYRSFAVPRFKPFDEAPG